MNLLKNTIPVFLAIWLLGVSGHAIGQQSQPADASETSTGPVVTPGAELSPEEKGTVFFAEDRYQAAIEAFKQVNPPTATAWNKMGISYQKMYNVDEALKCYEAAHKLEPTNVNYLNNLATAYAGTHQPGNAEKAYRKALKIDPNDALIYKNLGTLYISQGKLSKAKRAYDEARNIDPSIFINKKSLSIDEPTSVHGRGAMNYMMARSCVQMGQTDCALSYLRASINQGYTTTKKVESDPDFKPLLNVYAFQQMIAELNEKQNQSGAQPTGTGRPE